MSRMRLFVSTVLLAALALAPLREARADDDPWVGPDKAMHFGLSAGLAAGGYGLSALFLEPKWARATAGASFALSLGVAKELWDLTGHGDPSWKDLAWDALGTAVGIGLALAVDFAVRGTSDGAKKEPARAPAAGLSITPGGLGLTF